MKYNLFVLNWRTAILCVKNVSNFVDLCCNWLWHHTVAIDWVIGLQICQCHHSITAKTLTVGLLFQQLLLLQVDCLQPKTVCCLQRLWMQLSTLSPNMPKDTDVVSYSLFTNWEQSHLRWHNSVNEVCSCIAAKILLFVKPLVFCRCLNMYKKYFFNTVAVFA